MKPQRVASGALVNGRTFTLDKTTVTLAEVQPGKEETTFTLKLPRQNLEGIRDVRFFDAKGQPVQINHPSHGSPWCRIRRIMVGAAYS